MNLIETEGRKPAAITQTVPAIPRYAAIPLRAIAGGGFIQHGYAKLSRGPDAFAAILQSLHVPFPHFSAYLTIGVELFGGAALLLGAFVALVSIPTIIVLLTAMFTVHLPYGFSSIKIKAIVDGRAQFGPPGYEVDLLYIACILALVFLGPSPWSIDHYRLWKTMCSRMCG
jgi:putative oxidoreductase